MRFIVKAAGWLAALSLLGGCVTAPQQPVALAGDYGTSAKTGRVGIAVSELPKPDTAFPGAGCLLCLAAASMANSSLTDHARTLSVEELKPLKAELAKLLQAQGIDAVVIDEPLKLDSLPDRSDAAPNTARKDFSALRTRHKVDRVLYINLTGVGYTRAYSAYVPTGDPQATLQGTGMLVNLSTHALEWYQPIDTRRPADGKWDEPPKFPGLTNAYYQALEAAMDQIKQPFAKK